MEDYKFKKILALGIIFTFVIATIAVPNVKIFFDVEHSFSARASELLVGAPDKPATPSGNISGIICLSYNYSTSTKDSEGLNVSYGWDWNGDLIVDEWTGWYESNETCNTSHFWWEPGQYNVSVKAKNELENESDWSDSLNVTMNNLPPFEPTAPEPKDGLTDVDLNIILSWMGGDPNSCDTVTYDVYFGTTHPPAKVSSNQTDTFYDPGTLNIATHYVWMIIAWDNHSASTQGPMWSFVTRENNAPNEPTNPSPFNGATNISIDTDLSWACNDPDGDPLVYDVYFEANDDTPDTKVSQGQSGTSYNPPESLVYGTDYYWQIVAKDDYGGSTAGPIWSFKTEMPQPPIVEIIKPKEKSFYLRNIRLFPFFLTTIVYGAIDIEVNASAESGIKYVELYVNGKSKGNLSDEPYVFEWSPIICSMYKIKVIAVDNTGQSAEDTITVLKWRVHPVLLLAGSLIVLKQMRSPLKRTLIRGTVFNLRRVGNTYHGRAIRLRFTEFSGLTRVSGVIKLQRVSFGHSLLLRKYDLGPLGLTTYVVGIVPGGIK